MTEVTNTTILDEIRKTKQDLKSVIEALEVKLLLKIEETTRRISELEKENTRFDEEIEKLDRRCKQNNIVIFGLNEVKPLSVEGICHTLKQLLEVEVNPSHINNFFRLGKSEDCPVKVEFVSYLKKSEIFKNISKLKGTAITVSNDLTVKQRQDHRILYRHLQLAKQNNHKSCYIKKNRLYVDGQVYGPGDLQGSEECGDVFEVKSNSAPDTPTLCMPGSASNRKTSEAREQILIENIPKTPKSHVDRVLKRGDGRELNKQSRERKVTRSTNK